jgi:hypothetical protein
MTQHGYYDPTQDSTPLPQMEVFPHGEAARKERRAFLYASVIFGLAGFAAGAAFGETIQIGGVYVNGAAQVGTTVTINPSDEPGEWARVVMDNRHVNDGSDTGAYVLTFDGVPVGVQFLWDSDPVLGSDAITLTPPAGITCQPADCRLTVPEGFTGEMVLLDFMGF